jgi:hypothetical protein
MPPFVTWAPAVLCFLDCCHHVSFMGRRRCPLFTRAPAHTVPWWPGWPRRRCCPTWPARHRRACSLPLRTCPSRPPAGRRPCCPSPPLLARRQLVLARPWKRRERTEERPSEDKGFFFTAVISEAVQPYSIDSIERVYSRSQGYIPF